MEHRTLRSKKLRAMLYYSQNGKCAMCGNELPDNWHADHITPYVVTHRTNVHEMQALCSTCNLKKGKKMLRKHQADIQTVAREILSGAKISNILVHVTPGGGKSALPMILAKELAEPKEYKICWVVPRDALRSQGERDFIDKQPLFGHKSVMRAAGNDVRPARDTIGYITTYQAIAANPQLHIDEFKLRKYILVLDECHHIPYKGQGDDEEAKYYEAIKPLVDLSRIRIFASGTLERHDGNKIAFLPYKRNVNAEIIDTSPREDWDFIRYSRKDALEELAIVPLHFHVMDGRAIWLDPMTGESRYVNSMAEAAIKDQPAVLKTVLETDYAYQLLDKCVMKWQEYKEYVYSKAKMLVVAPSIDVARDYCKYLQKQRLNAVIATSDDSDEAKDNIRKFKKGNIDILVTVGMAYEGLDVPQITHVACLTNIRSRPWIEQCICRANRTDVGKTHGYIFYPDEPRMQKIIDAIAKEQAAAVFNNELNPPMPASAGKKGEYVSIVPQQSETTRAKGIGLEDGTLANYNETVMIENAMNAAKIKGMSIVQAKQFMVALGAGVVPNSTNPPDYNENVLTPSESEQRFKKSIERSIKRIAKGDSDKIIEINKQLKTMFGSRDYMTTATMQLALRWLEETFGGVL